MTNQAGLRIEELYGAHGGAILRYLSGRVGAAAAEDLTAETFLNALRGWHSFDPDRGTPLSWLFGIATNVVRGHRQQEVRHLRTVTAAAATAELATLPADSGIDRVDADARIRRLAPALLALEPLDRDILLPVSWAQLPQTEIAELLGLPPSTVRSRLLRTRRRLREAAAQLPDRRLATVIDLRRGAAS